MSRRLKITIGIGVSLLIIIVASLIFLRFLVVRSFPVTDGSLTVEGIGNQVHIYRDQLGVPHIQAATETDLFFAIGYVHAQDRLWQMDLIRRTGQGRLSEVIGKPALDFDQLFRTLDLDRLSINLTKHLHPEVLIALEAYARGVNNFIEQNRSRLPIEFDMLDYRPEPWEPQHSVLVARMMAWELNLASMTDLALGQIASKVGIKKALALVPAWPAEAPSIVPEIHQKSSQSKPRIVDEAAIGVLKRGVFPTRFLEWNQMYREQASNNAQSGGSNSWVVSSSRSERGRPILANDIHLPMPAPARWYQIHFTSNDRGWNVAGLTVPGAPLVVFGRNSHLAWGITNVMADDTDFFVERLDSSRTSQFIDGRWYPLEVREERILIKDADSLMFTVRRGIRGPIVDEFAIPDSLNPQSFHQYGITMRWTGYELSDEIYGFYLMNKARNAAEFDAGAREITVPGLNFVYADTAGNIGYWTAARIPIRRGGHGMFPIAGWTSANDWQGFIPTGDLPRLWNPADDFIATANNNVAGDWYQHHISDLWDPPSRIERIHELLSSTDQFGEDDFRRFQMDRLSPFGKKLAAEFTTSLRSLPTPDAETEALLEYFRNWDFRFESNDVASSAINVGFVKLVQNIFGDELDQKILGYYLSFSGLPSRAIERLLDSDPAGWFDDVRTDSVETKHLVILRSIQEAIGDLRTKFGSDLKNWRWGNLHTVTFEHPFGRIAPLDRVLNIGPFPIGGGLTTVNKADFRLNRPYATSVGPSIRNVIDLGNHDFFWSVITTGQSGQPLHDHYDDQSLLWLNGGYHKILLNWNTIVASGWDHLVLELGDRAR